MSWKGLLVAASLSVVFLTLSLSFQNCGPGYTTNQSGANSAAAIPPLTPPVSGALEAFTAGVAFNYSLVPMQSQMLQVQLTDTQYATSTSARAVAVNSAGLGFVSTVTDGNQDEASQIALESCYAIGGSEPCALLAIAGNFAISASDLNWSATYSYSVTSNTQFNSSDILFLSFADRNTAAYGYINAQSPKALAISVDGTYMVASASGNFGTKTDSRSLAGGSPPNVQENVPATDAEAQRMALQMCEMMSKYLPCTLFALDANVVLNPAKFNYSPSINYQPTAVTEVPGISNAVFVSSFSPGLSTNNSLITADGDFGDNPTLATATSQCAGAQAISNTGTYPCFAYTQGSASSVSIVQNLTAIRAHSLTTHCRVMPRASCAAHAAVGCSAGSFYVIQPSGTVQLTVCP